MTALTEDVDMAQAMAAAGLGGLPFEPGPSPLASPSYKALESRSVLVETPDGPVFLKRMHPEMRDGFDLPAAMQLATQAGAAGVAPRVIWSDSGLGSIAMQGLTQGWRTATQYSLQAALPDAILALRQLHETAPLTHRFDPFAAIDAQIEALAALQVLPEDSIWLRRVIGLLEPMLDDAALAPCRNDGSASNLMLGPDRQVMLVDFDRAGMNDPLYDVGCLLAEATDFPQDMHAAFSVYWGHFDQAAFARARLWSAVDDMLHAFWARRLALVSVRRNVEWLKYGEWRLMRLRLVLNHPDFEQLIRLSRERIAA
ncbi:phosphotransferase [Paracoccus laeviglucosivorans]|uniref:Thiamine kinase n=1 Tax=Paracoccus laeviglucosivorans TaxID=1197861 RepID=A0A521F2T9_9RHOB|nr:phosphotransferase [Paracoccus laeviglucosivorans]SMO90475.1 Thiamine kinase [Paracoccus laeviglucosivorans]